MTGPDLKPCPFCGSKNIGWAWRSAYSIDSSYAFFGCLDCRMGSDEASEDNTLDPCDAAAWNRRDPAVLAALPEVQALIAAAYEAAVGASMSYGPSYYMTQVGSGFQETHTKLGAFAFRTDIRDAIRNLTPADATAALARIEREAEARGRVKGLREAAGIAEGAWGEGPTGHYDNGGTMDGWNLACSHVDSAILARAEQIEADALIEVYYQREMASDEPQGPHDLSIGGE